MYKALQIPSGLIPSDSSYSCSDELPSGNCPILLLPQAQRDAWARGSYNARGLENRRVTKRTGRLSVTLNKTFDLYDL